MNNVNDLQEFCSMLEYGNTVWMPMEQAEAILDKLSIPQRGVFLEWLARRNIKMKISEDGTKLHFVKELPLGVGDEAKKHIIMEFIAEVDAQANTNIANTGKLEGSHNAAINQVLRRRGYTNSDRN